MKQIPKQTGHFKSFDGTPIYYEVRGRGKPVIMAYGIACLINHWRHQIKYFSDKYKTIVFDYRGHHKTPAPQNRDYLSLDGIAQDIDGLCQHLKIEKASFWGHSWGAQVLIRTFDMFPSRFHDMVFVNGFATNPLQKTFGVEAVPTTFNFLKQTYENLPETMGYLWKTAVTNPISIQLSALAGGFNLNLTNLKDIEIYARGVAAIDLEVFIKLFDQLSNYDGNSVLDRINVPTLIIGGRKDTVTPKEYQETLHQRIKGSQYLSVPYGSHCTQLDLPDFVNLRIEKFLREHKYR